MGQPNRGEPSPGPRGTPSREELIEDLGRLFPIPSASAEDYFQSTDVLALRVDKALLARADQPALVGRSGAAMMRNNHCNHAEFMANVFLLNLPELVVRVVPWVYRTYRWHGFALDYFPVQLEAWKEAVSAQIDIELAAPIHRVYDWMISQHETMAALADEEARQVLSSQDYRLPPEARGLLEMVLAGDAWGFLSAAEKRMTSPEAIIEFYLGTVEPIMREVGLRWEQGRATVAVEHLATAIVSSAMATTYSKMASRSAGGPKAVITAAPNEFHELGARMTADIFELSGWDVVYLGANTPPADLTQLVAAIRPKVVGVSVTMPFNLLWAREIVEAIRADESLGDVRVLTGGGAICLAERAAEAVGADGWAPDALKGVELASSW